MQWSVRKIRKDVLGRIQREELAQLTKDACRYRESYQFPEKAIGEFVLDLGHIENTASRPVRQEIDPNRINAVRNSKGPRRRYHRS